MEHQTVSSNAMASVNKQTITILSYLSGNDLMILNSLHLPLQRKQYILGSKLVIKESFILSHHPHSSISMYNYLYVLCFNM